MRVALNETFSDDPDHHDLSPAKFREFYLRARGVDPALWTLAWAGAELAGFVLAYPERGGDPRLGWVGTLGVRVGVAPPRPRVGAARSAFLALYERGLRRVGLGVDAENVTGAARACTSVPVCASCDASTTGCLRCERVARPVSRLPDTHSGRGRPRLSMPCVWS